MIKVAIVDDNPLLTRSLQEKLAFFDDIQCRFTAVNGIDCLEKMALYPTVELLLMDIEMPMMNGIETTSEIKRKYPHLKVLILTVFDDYDAISKAIRAGADGYLLKDISPDELKRGITEIVQGGAYITPSIALKTLQMFREPEQFTAVPQLSDFGLTERELEVLKQLSTGLKYEQIAQNLFLSVGTVRKHVENIYAKLHVHNKLEAISMARQHQLI
ncbi:MAG: hypothetical protein RIS29_2656 [Bacteroidota bacterium]|jgi:DNA-binding NarL/FixJ family response regulator